MSWNNKVFFYILYRPVFAVLSRCGSICFHPFIAKQQSPRKNQNNHIDNDPVTARRRERALKALDEKLKQLESGPPQ